MKKVLVLGSTGMLGHIVHYYLDSTNIYDIYNLSFRIKLNTKTIIVDISDQQKLSNLINEISSCPREYWNARAHSSLFS